MRPIYAKVGGTPTDCLGVECVEATDSLIFTPWALKLHMTLLLTLEAFVLTLVTFFLVRRTTTDNTPRHGPGRVCTEAQDRECKCLVAWS